MEGGLRVLLVIPTFKYPSYPEFLSFSDFPTGFGYLASSLKKAGHEVYGLNPNNTTGYVNAKTMLTDVLTKRIHEIHPELIGLGGLATDYAFLRDAIEIIRKTDPAIPIVLGGQIVTNDAEDIFNILKPDYAVVGDGEYSILRLVAALPAIPDIPNLWYWDNGQAKTVTHGLEIRWLKELESNIDNLSYPDYEPFGIKDMLDNYSMATRLLYRYTRVNPRPYGIVTARGCPFACTFCVDHHRTYRERSIDSIMAEITKTYEEYHYNILLILDELFAVNKERMNEFSKRILKGRQELGWDFDWQFQTHASAKLDLASLTLAKKAGCTFFSYGLESASPAVLQSMDKRITIKQVKEAIKLAEEAKVGFGGNLIFGDPAETQETFAESISFWLENTRSSFVFLSQLMPYPGSKVFKFCQEKGMFKDKKEYYEKIDQLVPNMTTIPNNEFSGLLAMTQFLEKSWLFTKTTPILKTEEVDEDSTLLTFQGGRYYRVTSKCPYCGEEIIYKERVLDISKPFWLGTGCTKCNRKIKVVTGG